MNAVEIEEAITLLADQPFDPENFPFAFLEAFGNKATTIKRLKSGSSNSSDIEGGVLQRNNIHMVVCAADNVTNTLSSLKDSPATNKAKAKFILATDGVDLEAEDLASGEAVACQYSDFSHHFGFFLPLAGITTVKQIRGAHNHVDVVALQSASHCTSNFPVVYSLIIEPAWRFRPIWVTIPGTANEVAKN